MAVFQILVSYLAVYCLHRQLFPKAPLALTVFLLQDAWTLFCNKNILAAKIRCHSVLTTNQFSCCMQFKLTQNSNVNFWQVSFVLYPFMCNKDKTPDYGFLKKTSHEQLSRKKEATETVFLVRNRQETQQLILLGLDISMFLSFTENNCFLF